MTSEHFDTLNNNEHNPVVKEAVEDVLNPEIETTEGLKVFTETKKTEATTESENLIVEGDNAIDSLVKSIGASPDDAVEGKSRLAQISEKVKGNLKSFILKVSMVGALGGLAGQSDAMAIDPPNDKEKGKKTTPKENMVSISDKEEYERRSKAYNDSLHVYNESIQKLNKERQKHNERIENYNKNKDFYLPEVYRKESTFKANLKGHTFDVNGDLYPAQYYDYNGIKPVSFVQSRNPPKDKHVAKMLGEDYFIPNGNKKTDIGLRNVGVGTGLSFMEPVYKKPVQKPVFIESKTPIKSSPKKEASIKSEVINPAEKTVSQQEEKKQVETVPQTGVVSSIPKQESFSNKAFTPNAEKVMQKFPTKERISYTTFLNEKNPEFDYVKDEVLAKKGDPSPYFRVKKEEQEGEYNPHLILRAEGEMQRNAYTNPHAWEAFVRKSAKEKINDLMKDISTDNFKEMSPERQQKAKEFIEGEIEKTKLDQEWYIKNYESVTKPYRESFKKYDEEKAWLQNNISGEEYKKRLTQFEGLDASVQEERLQNLTPEYSLGDGSNYNFKTKNIELNLDPEEPNMIHEGEHQATDAESGMSEFAKDLYKKAFTKQYMTEGDQIINMGQEGYFENVTEIDARKKVLEYEMEKLGVKKYSEKFTQEHYQKLLELQKEGKLSKNSNQFLRMIKPKFVEQIMTTIAFEDVGNNSTETPTA